MTDSHPDYYTGPQPTGGRLPPPSLPFMSRPEWPETKETLHRFLQIIGKVRLDQGVPLPDAGHTAMQLTGRGLTTRPMGWHHPFTIDVDFVDHRLDIHAVSGETASFSLLGLTVADFYRKLSGRLANLGIVPTIRAVPYDLQDAVPFAADTLHGRYDPALATNCWRALSLAGLLLEEFAGCSSVRSTPVQFFWHRFDLAIAEFPAAGQVVTLGFTVGDNLVPEPGFFGVVTPEPAGLVNEPLQPGEARWISTGNGHAALLPCKDVRTIRDSRAMILQFLHSAYSAATRNDGQ